MGEGEQGKEGVKGVKGVEENVSPGIERNV